MHVKVGHHKSRVATGEFIPQKRKTTTVHMFKEFVDKWSTMHARPVEFKSQQVKWANTGHEKFHVYV